MRYSSLLFYAAFALSGAFAQAQSQAQTSASAQSQSSGSGGKDGASATSSSAAAVDASGHRSQAALGSGSEINATLSRPVDAGQNKPGDEVTAIATEDMKSNGQVVIPKGSRLVGHVTSVKERRSGNTGPSDGVSGAASGSTAGTADSQLGILFDKAVLKDGREIPLHATIQAIAAGEASSSSGLSQSDLMTSGAGNSMAEGRATGGGLLGGVGGPVRGTAGAATNLGASAGSTLGGSAAVVGQSAGAVGGVNATGRLMSGSHGAFGMRGFDVISKASGSGEASLVTSSAHTVRLEKGTRVLLVTGSSVAAGAASSSSGVQGAADTGANASGSMNSTRGTQEGSAGAAATASGSLSAAGSSGRTNEAPKDNTPPTRDAKREEPDRR